MATSETNQQTPGPAPAGSGADQIVAKAAAKVGSGSGAGEPAPKRPVGRPPKIKAATETGGGSPDGGSGVPPFDPGVVKSSVESLLRTVDRFVVRKIYSTAFEITNNEKRSQALAGDVALTPEEAKSVPDLAEICAKQYGLLGQHAPAIFLTIFAAGYAGRTIYALSQLREIAELNAKAAVKAPATPEEKIVAMPKDADKPQSVQTPRSGN